MKAAAAVRAYLGAQWQAIADGEAALRLDQSGVHPVRVAVRRFRSTLRTFGGLFPAAAVDRLDAELAWYGDVLGQVRDRQVQRRRFADALAQLPDELVLGPVAARIEQDLLAEQVTHTRQLVRALDSERYRRLRVELARWAAAPPLAGRIRPRTLRRLTRRSAGRASRRLDRGLAGDDAALHRARKAAKRTRYAAELLQPLRPRARRAARRHERLQTLLGEHQDSVVARDLLRRWGAGTAHEPGENGFTFGLLHQRESEIARRARKRAHRWAE